MSTQTYSKIEFRRHIVPEDFKAFSLDTSSAERIREQINAVAEAAHEISSSELFPAGAINVGVVKGSKIYANNSFAAELVLRKTQLNIQAARGIRFRSRNDICSLLVEFLKDGSQYRLYRLDIKSFFETIDINYVLNCLNSDGRTSQKTARIAESFLFHVKGVHGCTGLPRGIGISSVLSEVAVEGANDFCRRHPEVFLFLRFVDDIVIVTSGTEVTSTFINEFVSSLQGMVLNERKQSISFLPAYREGNSLNAIVPIDYLGYRFKISEWISGKPIKDRPVSVAIAPKKLAKIKTRIVRALIEYRKNRNFILLRDRIRILTSNYEFYDARRARKILSGIYFSYPQVDDESCLKELDRFLYWAIFRNVRCPVVLTGAQRRILRSHSFVRGFRSRRLYYFAGRRLAEIQKCWIYG